MSIIIVEAVHDIRPPYFPYRPWRHDIRKPDFPWALETVIMLSAVHDIRTPWSSEWDIIMFMLHVIKCV